MFKCYIYIWIYNQKPSDYNSSFSTSYNFFDELELFRPVKIFCDELQLSASYHFRRRSTVRQTETAELLRLHRLLRRNRDDGSEGPRLPDCQVGQDFCVQLHVATVQRLAHVPSVVAVFGRGRVDSCNNKINFVFLNLITVFEMNSLNGIINVLSDKKLNYKV